MNEKLIKKVEKLKDLSSFPYRPCVGIMVLSCKGFVWVGRRCVDDIVKRDADLLLWQMPQGGIDIGETPLNAAYRELYEETGIKSVSLLKEGCACISYDFPDHFIDREKEIKYRGQTQKWFAFRFEGDEKEICVDRRLYGYKSEFDAWAWKPMRDIPKMVVDFKRNAYMQVINEFMHLSV